MTADSMRQPEGEKIIEHLGQLGRDLGDEIAQLGTYERDAVAKEGQFRADYARAYDKATGNMETCKQQAIAETDDQWRAWQQAAILVRIQRESLRALHARIDIGRTMASREKSLMALAGHGGET